MLGSGGGSDDHSSSLSVQVTADDEETQEEPRHPAIASSWKSMIIEALYDWDSWWNDRHEIFCAFYPLLCYIAGAVILLSWRPVSLPQSLLYKSIELDRDIAGFPVSAWLLSFCTMNITLGVHQILLLARELAPTWRSVLFLQDKRIEVCARINAVLPLPVYSVLLLWAAVGEDDHLKRMRLGTLALWLVWSVGYVFFTSLVSVFSHPSEVMLRPSILLPLTMLSSSLCLLGQAHGCGMVPNRSITAITWWASVFLYIICIWVGLSLGHFLWRLAACGERISPRFYDTLFFSVFLLIWFQLSNLIGVPSSQRLVVSGTEFDFSMWLILRLGPGCAFMAFWSLRVGEFVLRRAEHEAKLRADESRWHLESLEDLKTTLSAERVEKKMAEQALREARDLLMRAKAEAANGGSSGSGSGNCNDNGNGEGESESKGLGYSSAVVRSPIPTSC